jgi:hypothetical protein
LFASVARALRPGGRLILRDMTAKTGAMRRSINRVGLPRVRLTGHGDVRVYSVDEVRRLRDLFGENFVVSPSHESILPDVPWENVQAMAEAAAE